MRPLVFDTETADKDGGVCEIAIVQIDEACNIVGEHESLIDPERPISDEAGGVHGLRIEDLLDKPTMDEFIEVYGNPFVDDDLVLIAFNAKFDERQVKKYLPSKYRVMCALRLARNLWPERESHKLQTLAYAFRLGTGPAHRAMGDVVTLVNLLKHMMAETGMSFQQLLELSQQPLSLETRITFGKHKGDKLKDLPISYVRWILGQADMDQDLKDALAVRLQ
jgi:exodeoxyribonuclease X